MFRNRTIQILVMGLIFLLLMTIGSAGEGEKVIAPLNKPCASHEA